ncbi:unnamed protein product [Paramecium sonneborni]|uniref:Uncharacterized protein n=1 Tax=Paramecium sonneborni TaxID=65129 RepID=A0A8S1P5H6_9CILI|nr:unnamed protein product [Paramecium sonneborni]
MNSFVKIFFLNSIVYQNCITDDEQDCKYTDFSVVGSSGSTLARCGSGPKSLYMGPYGLKTSVTLTITNFPPNNQMELQIGIWKIDSWDGEVFEIYANDIQIDSIIQIASLGVSTCRNLWEDICQSFSVKCQMNGTDLTIKLKDNFDQSLWDESWGFRDFILKLSVPCVNFYSECNYSGKLFQICKGEQTKRVTRIPYEIKSVLMAPNIIVKIKDPNYYGGVLQQFSTSQSCIESYKILYNNKNQFPKYIPSS